MYLVPKLSHRACADALLVGFILEFQLVMAGPPVRPQLPPLHLPPPPVRNPAPGPDPAQALMHPPGHGQSNQPPLHVTTNLMEMSNFKVLEDLQGTSACVTLLHPNGPWKQLPGEFLDSLLCAVRGLPVHELILKRHQLNAVPRNFGQISSLCVLDLSFNRLECVPDSLCQLHQLQQLYLQHNQIAAVPQALGKQLGKLKQLYLQHNKLPTLPAGVCRCTTLEILNVDNNRIESFSEEVDKLKNLKQLHACCNLVKFLPASLYRLCDLEELYLSNNCIQHIYDMCNMTSLKQLHLANNKLQFLPLSIATMHQLQGLTLTGNNMRFPPLSVCRPGIHHMQQYMIDKLENSVLDLANGSVTTNLYYAGSDHEADSGNESPFENID